MKIYYQNSENALGQQKPEEFENSTDHMAYAFFKNPSVTMVTNEEDADYIIRHPDIGIQTEPLHPNKEIIVDYFDSDEQQRNVLGCDTNCIMSRKPLLYFKRSCVDKTITPYQFKDYDMTYIPLTYGIKECNLRNLPKENQVRDIDVSCFFNAYDNGYNRSAVSRTVSNFSANHSQYDIRVGRVGSGYSYEGNKNFFDQIKNSKIVVSCNPDGWEGDFRLFEALAGGALVFVDTMLVPKARGLKHKEHVIYYDNLVELEELLTYYLVNKEEAAEIAKNGHDEAVKNFTYDSNCKMIIEEIKKKSV